MSLAREVAREQAAPRRKRLTKALQRARRDARTLAWSEEPIADAVDFEIDDLEGAEVNSVRKLAGVAFVAIVLAYALALGVSVSGC